MNGILHYQKRSYIRRCGNDSKSYIISMHFCLDDPNWLKLRDEISSLGIWLDKDSTQRLSFIAEIEPDTGCSLLGGGLTYSVSAIHVYKVQGSIRFSYFGNPELVSRSAAPEVYNDMNYMESAMRSMYENINPIINISDYEIDLTELESDIQHLEDSLAENNFGCDECRKDHERLMNYMLALRYMITQNNE